MSIKDGGKVYPDEYISRSEYAIMAEKILAYNQCKVTNDTSKVPSEIVIKDKNGNILKKTVFQKDSTDFLAVI